MNSLPSSVNYAEVLPSLPENATRYSVALQPTNGSKFISSSQIILQFPNRGYLIPDSVYLRYKQTVTNTQSNRNRHRCFYSRYACLHSIPETRSTVWFSYS